MVCATQALALANVRQTFAACRVLAGNMFLRPQQILSLRGAADLDKREQARFPCVPVHQLARLSQSVRLFFYPSTHPFVFLSVCLSSWSGHNCCCLAKLCTTTYYGTMPKFEHVMHIEPTVWPDVQCYRRRWAQGKLPRIWTESSSLKTCMSRQPSESVMTDWMSFWQR